MATISGDLAVHASLSCRTASLGPYHKAHSLSSAQQNIDRTVAISKTLSHLQMHRLREEKETMAKELERMSLRELQEFELKLKKAKAHAQDKTRTELRQKIEKMVADAGFKISDLFGGRGGKGRTVAAKYANPDDPSETWTGRGRKPKWLSAKLSEGHRIEKFLIK
ncbi:MAG TPA: H-NS histone family protein [Hyphomicrobiaceae bacterium]|jgi:DNA-binding protein H-NS|nr:H-NS histone family protein [Hyphomicrobiaceae bacterium]